MKNDILRLIYEKFLYDNFITLDELKKMGIDSEMIDELLEKKMLVINNEEVSYGPNSAWEFLKLASFLLRYNKIQKGVRALEISYELNPNNTKTNALLFYWSIYIGKIDDKLYKYLDEIIGLNSEYEPYLNTTLFLLNALVELPPKYKDYTRNIELSDMLLKTPIKSSVDIELENEIITALWKCKYKHAFSLMRRYVEDSKVDHMNIRVIKSLTNQIIPMQTQNIKGVSELIKAKKYEEVHEHFKNLYKERIPTPVERALYQIVKEILKIQNTKTIPKPKTKISKDNYKSTFDALQNNDYYSALEMATLFKGNANDDSMYLLLGDLCALIDEYNKKYKRVHPIFEKAITLLNSGKTEKAMSTICTYLDKNGKSEYKLLVTLLIKVDILNREFDFEKSSKVFNNVLKENFYVYSGFYSNRVKEMIARNKLDIAGIYLQILNTYCRDNEPKKLELLNKQYESALVTGFTCEEQKLLAEIYPIIKDNQDVIILDKMDMNSNCKILHYVKYYKHMDAFLVGARGDERVVLCYKDYQKIDESEINEEIRFSKKSGDLFAYLNANKSLLISKDHYNPIVFSRIAKVYKKLGKYDEAIKYYTIATELSKRTDAKIDHSSDIFELQNKILDFSKIK